MVVGSLPFPKLIDSCTVTPTSTRTAPNTWRLSLGGITTLVKEAETNQKKKTLWVCNPTLAVCQIKSEHGGSVDYRTSATPGCIFCLVSSSSRRWQQMKAEQRQVFEVSEVHLSRDEAAKLRLPGHRSTFFLPLIRAGPFWTAGARHRLRFFSCDATSGNTLMMTAVLLSFFILFYFFYTGFNKRRRKINRTNIYINISHTVKSKPCFPVGLCVTFEK